MCIVKFFVWICFVFALILVNGQDVLESSSEPLNIALETENETKDPIEVVSTAVVPKIIEVSEGPENASKKVDPVKPLAIEIITTENVDINPTKAMDLSDYQSDAAHNDLSTMSNEVVVKPVSVEILPSVATETSEPEMSQVSGDGKPNTLEMNDVNEVAHEVTEPPEISSEDKDDSKENNHIKTVDSMTQVPTTAALPLLKCYSCSSERNISCIQHPVKEVGCSVRQGQTHNGCFALVKANTNITTRGCIAELTDEDLRYCRNSKQCVLCYEPGCNQVKISSSSGLTNFQSKSILTVFGVVIVRFINRFN